MKGILVRMIVFGVFGAHNGDLLELGQGIELLSKLSEVGVIIKSISSR